MSEPTRAIAPSPDTTLVGVGEGPAPTPPTLGETLDRVEAFLRRYVVLSRPEAVTAIVLWVAHTHAIEHADATPYLAITSPEKQSGKTRLLECLALLAYACDGIVVTPTAATIYRSLASTPGATLLLDELDAVFRDHSDRYEEVRAVINAGHRRGATVPRSVPGKKNGWQIQKFEVFGPKALAGIGRLPDTVSDRAIPIAMSRRRADEPVVRFRERRARAEAASLVEALRAALAATPPAIEAHIPPGLPDRAADAWEPLLAIAEVAGGTWCERARTAALVLHARNDADGSLGLRLLADARRAFDRLGTDRVPTATLISALRAEDDGPWADDRYPLTPHRLGRLLAPWGIHPKQLRVGGQSVKGYERVSFVDAWDRYLPTPSPPEAKHRNNDRARRFDVSVPASTEDSSETDAWDLAVELDYPASAWDVELPAPAGERIQ